MSIHAHHLSTSLDYGSRFSAHIHEEGPILTAERTSSHDGPLGWEVALIRFVVFALRQHMLDLQMQVWAGLRPFWSISD